MGPLAGIRVIEIASTAPAPFGCMLLADHGAEVTRVDRLTAAPGAQPSADPLARGRRSIAVDLKTAFGVDVVQRLAERADVLVEGFRPGVMERLGLGPGPLLQRNPRLVYARMTGWGQEGPLAHRAGHDINYIAVAGALAPIGRADRPSPPLNLVGDFGGGGMLLAFGIVTALLEREKTGRGQVVDAAMVDGSSLLMSFVHGLAARGQWNDSRESNLLDGGAPFYDTYQTVDGGFMAVGALERRFYDQLLLGLGLAEDAGLPAQMDRAGWPELRQRFAAVFRTRTRQEWTALFDQLDACVSPVLAPTEVPGHAHMLAREAFVVVDGLTQPAPAPRFSSSPAAAPTRPPFPGEHTELVLRELGLAADGAGEQVAADGVSADAVA